MRGLSVPTSSGWEQMRGLSVPVRAYLVCYLQPRLDAPPLTLPQQVIGQGMGPFSCAPVCNCTASQQLSPTITQTILKKAKASRNRLRVRRPHPALLRHVPKHNAPPHTGLLTSAPCRSLTLRIRLARRTAASQRCRWDMGFACKFFTGLSVTISFSFDGDGKTLGMGAAIKGYRKTFVACRLPWVHKPGCISQQMPM